MSGRKLTLAVVFSPVGSLSRGCLFAFPSDTFPGKQTSVYTLQRGRSSAARGILSCTAGVQSAETCPRWSRGARRLLARSRSLFVLTKRTRGHGVKPEREMSRGGLRSAINVRTLSPALRTTRSLAVKYTTRDGHRQAAARLEVAAALLPPQCLLISLSLSVSLSTTRLCIGQRAG